MHEPYWSDGTLTLHTGEPGQVLAGLPAGSIDCVVTRPPDLEAGHNAAAYVAGLRRIFAAVRQVLAADGTAWLALADTFGDLSATRDTAGRHARPADHPGHSGPGHRPPQPGARSLLGIPWQVAVELQHDGWIVRSALAWHDQAGTTGRGGQVARGDKLIFLLVKQPSYWFDSGAMSRPTGPLERSHLAGGHGRRDSAAFPAELAMRCIAAGCRPGGVVLDMFCATTPTGIAAVRLGRRFTGIAPDAAACNQIRAQLSHERSHDSGGPG